MPQLAGKAMATPEPAVTKAMPLRAGPSLYKSSFDKASTTAMDTPWACNSAIRAVTAVAPSATVLKSIKPTLRWHWACNTFTKLASRMGVSGWFFIPLSLSSTSPTNKWPLNTVRWLSGNAGVAMVKGQFSASINASVTGPILPRTSPLYQLSKVEQYLKYTCLTCCSCNHAKASSDCFTASAGAMVRDFSATTTALQSAGSELVGTPMVCTTRIPARTKLLAKSVAPVKSSAMQPNSKLIV